MLDNQKIRSLCLAYTSLAESDIIKLEELAERLELMAGLNQTDMFIDAPIKDSPDSIVLAWAHDKKSLYKKSVVGEIAYAGCEPAVSMAIVSKERVERVSGVSQEMLPIEQTVVPLFNEQQKVIGVLIMERDISAEVAQEQQVKFLTKTAEHLSKTLMSLTTTGCGWDEWLGNGIFVLDERGRITYANKKGIAIAADFWPGTALQQNLCAFLQYDSLNELVDGLKLSQNFQYGHASYVLQSHPLVEKGLLSGCVISVEDVTELREKERQIDMQGVVIDEINHRVKNTLQNVISLLRMQMRRSNERQLQEEFMAGINRILSIAKVYEVFTYQSRELVNLRELSEYIMEKIIESYSNNAAEVKTRFTGSEVMLHATQAVPVALVLNELISNAVKHGLKNHEQGRMYIDIREQQEKVSISVWNNGEAVDVDVLDKLDKRKSLGLYLVKLFICEQLKGTVELVNCDNGVCAKIEFPLYGVRIKGGR